jgi:hypothetical protein
MVGYIFFLRWTLISVNNIDMIISRELEKINQEFGLHELVEQAARLIQLFVPKQEKYKVTDYPDPRTVRFYLTRGLMDKPHRYDGQKAIFNSKHLLQLIVIKYYLNFASAL